MKKITEAEFGLLCYLTLMNNTATEEKTIKYMVEKSPMMDDGYSAIQRLHPILRRIVIKYCERWGYEFPPEAKEYM